MLVVFWFSYNILIIICIPLCMIFNKINKYCTNKGKDQDIVFQVNLTYS